MICYGGGHFKPDEGGQFAPDFPQIVSIIGAKGVGKSTLIKQHLKQNYQPGDRRVLYCSADTVDFSTRSLVGLAEEFVLRGGELLVIDEIHKYRPESSAWSREVKEIYELFPKLKLIVSGSSLLQLKEGDADLSRRAIKYTMQGLSFREALRFYHGLVFPKMKLCTLYMVAGRTFVTVPVTSIA